MLRIDQKTAWVVGVMGFCSVLVVGMAVWLDSVTSPLSDTPLSDAIEEIDQLPAPLTAEELEAYQVDIVNPMNPKARFTTTKGVFELELFEDTMPITAGNFIKLAEEGFYEGIKFHRVIDGFIVQGGDPITKTDETLRYGTGGPGYTIPDEHIKGEYLTNVRGTISMANSGPNSGGSQFFINLADNLGLDFDKQPLSSKHPVFGRVISGMGVVDAIGTAETNTLEMPIEPVVIEKVEIIRG